MEGKKEREKKKQRLNKSKYQELTTQGQKDFCVHILNATICNNIKQVPGGVLTRDGVEKDEVIEVGYFASLPALGHVGCLK